MIYMEAQMTTPTPGTAGRKGATMAATTHPRTMGEIARIALPAIQSMKGCVGVTVEYMDAEGCVREITMNREEAEMWAGAL